MTGWDGKYCCQTHFGEKIFSLGAAAGPET